jgi:hypothetical protein
VSVETRDEPGGALAQTTAELPLLELKFYLLFATVVWFGLTYRRVVLRPNPMEIADA